MQLTRRRFVSLVGGAVVLSSATGCRRALRYFRDRNVKSGPSTTRTPPPEKPALGINIAAADDWNTELPFVDVFRLARAWSSQKEGVAYGEGPALSVDDDGWLKSLPAGAWAESMMCGAPQPPQGEWTVFYEGKGRIEMWAPAISGQVERGPGHLTFQVGSADNDGFFLRLRETDPSDPVRNIRVLMPGHAETYAKEPFNPRFIARWRGVSALRFMDFMKINNSPQIRWTDRPRPTHATWAERGLPVEVLVDLANRVSAAPWFTLPHQADDDYIRQFAAVVKAKLSPDLKVYVEYSNEVWNGQFAQARYAQEQGAAAGVGGTGFDEQLRFYARRAVQVFGLFEGVFGGRERLVRVLASQSASMHASEQIVGFEGAGESADALAIAPYLGVNVSQGGDEPTVKTVREWSLEKLFAHLDSAVLPEVTRAMHDQKALADKFGLALVAYEGGQHLTGVLGGENDDQVTALLMRANRDPRMGTLYDRYYAAWRAAGGSLFCHFTSVSRSNKWGSWGLLEHELDAPENAPKFQATMRFAQACGQNVGGA